MVMCDVTDALETDVPVFSLAITSSILPCFELFGHEGHTTKPTFGYITPMVEYDSISRHRSPRQRTL